MNQNTHDPIDGIVQLREELLRVSVSHGFVERVRERVADELEPLRAELADLNVSPEFAVRVRERVDEARRPLWGFNWRWAMPAAGLAAALVTVVLWPRTTVEPPAPSKAVTRVQPPVVEPPVAPPVVTSSTPRVAPPVAVVSHAGLSLEARSSMEAGSLDPARHRDPFLEVITDQPELLRRLYVAIDRSDVAVDATESAAMYQAPKLEVPRVEVSPVSLFVVPNLRAPIGVSPFILRIAADSAERSSK